MADRSVREFTTQAPAPYVGQFLQGGIFPYAQRFLHGQFANMGAPDTNPYTYTGPRVAQFDPREQMGMQMSDQAIGSYRPYLGSQSSLLGQATNYLRRGTGAGAELTGEAADIYRGAGRDFDPSAYKDYMSPYTDEVVDRSLGDIREQMEKQKMGVRDRAVSSGAFGGSRGRLAEGDIERAGLRSMGDISAQLRERGYGQSQQQAFQEFARRQAERGGTAQGLAGLGQQFYGMGAGSAGGLGSLGGMYGGMAPALQGLQTGDINRTMQFGGLGRGRQQSLMDLGYQNFVGQYNLPMQTLQNVGALTASLGPMAGGYGYAGQGMPTEFPGGGAYQPAGGGIGTPGAGSYTPYSTGAGNYQPYTPSTPTPGTGTPTPTPGVGPGPGIGPIYNQGPQGLPSYLSCPHPDEEILLADDSWIKAKDIQVGDKVKTLTAKDFKAGEYEVTRVDIIDNQPRCEVFFKDSKSIISSYSHPYAVEDKGFVEAQDIKAGDTVGDLIVTEVKPLDWGSVVSLSVDEAETYMLKGGSEDKPVALLSHNKSPGRFTGPTTPGGPPMQSLNSGIQPQSNLGGGPQTQPLAPVSPTNYNTYGNNMPVGFRYGGGIRSLKYNG